MFTEEGESFLYAHACFFNRRILHRYWISMSSSPHCGTASHEFTALLEMARELVAADRKSLGTSERKPHRVNVLPALR
jgi:hypothetical protein